MGLLKGLRNTAKAWREAIDAANEASQAAADEAPMSLIAPTPQAVVDELRAGTGTARGVVVKASHAPVDNERVSRMRVTVRCRARLGDGELGPVAEIKIWTSWQVVALLDRGLDIPVELDATRTVVTGIPAATLAAELAPRFGEAAERKPDVHFDPPF